MTFHHPVLIGDIGGTNARFALLPAPGAPMVALPRVLTADCPSPEAAIRDILREAAAPPRSAVLAVAARVEGPVVRMTNAHWTIDAAGIASTLGLDRVTLVNDYVPVAAALSALRPEAEDLVRIGPPLDAGSGPKVVLGPGTGLGAAALLPVGDRFLVLPTEAGHVEFGPAETDEAALWDGIERVCGRVTAETVLSGPGLVRLHQALVRASGDAAGFDAPSDVCAAGLSGDNRHAAAALGLFARLLGRFAGDLGVIFGAKGGVYIASGIAPRILDVLREGGFRAAFERKAPQDAFMRAVPTWVVLHPDPALLGLSVLAEQDERFTYPCATHR